jgi:hypothetical protein
MRATRMLPVVQSEMVYVCVCGWPWVVGILYTRGIEG